MIKRHLHGYNLKLVDGQYRLTLYCAEGEVELIALPSVLRDLGAVIDRGQQPFKVCSCCGRLFDTAADYAALPMPSAGEYGSGLWWRTCRCGSTIAVPVGNVSEVRS